MSGFTIGTSCGTGRIPEGMHMVSNNARTRKLRP